MRCFLQLALKMRTHTPSTDQGTDEILKYVVEKELMEGRRKSIIGAGKENRYVQEATTNMFLRR